jgi:hypothetical protein
LKLTNQSSPVEVQGGNNTGAFTIAFNSKAFRVLSDTLYENKIGAIVREISCNANDAHVQADKADQEFVIHLPDNFSPWFSVRDFGKGLSASDIKNVFTVYFASTKDQSNECTGMLGLGAKTPFSYTDQFTVTSYQDGICTIYSAFITESGVPNIIEMYSSESTEPSGVEIKLSVKSQDYVKFKNEVQEQLKFFKVKPRIENGTCTYQEQGGVVILETVDARIIDTGNSYYKKAPYIIQGNVGYPLAIDNLKEAMPEHYKFFESNLGLYIELNFEIGQIGVTASREGVEYNATTLANINAKMTLVRAQVQEYINAQLKSKVTEWERTEYLNSSQVLSRLAKDTVFTTATKFGSDWYFNLEAIMKRPAGGVLLQGMVYFIDRSMKNKKRSAGRIRPMPSDQLLVVLRDKTHLSATKIKHVLKTNPKLQQVYEIEMFDKQYDVQVVKTALGGFDNVILMSSIVLPSVASGVRSKSSVVSYYEYNEGNNIRDWDKSYESLKDVTEPMVYVIVKDANLVNFQDVARVSQYEELKKFDDVLDLIALREASVKHLNSECISLEQYINQKTEEHQSDEDFFIYKKNLFYTAVKSQVHDWNSKAKMITSKAPDNELARLIAFANKVKKSSVYSDSKITPEFNAKVNFMKYNSLVHSVPTERKYKMKTFYANILDKYPLLKVSAWEMHRNISDVHLCEYLKQMQKVL